MATATLMPSGVLTNREKLWTAMRQLRTFTTLELSVASKVDRRASIIKEYTGALVRAEVLKRSGRPDIGEFVLFELVRDLGVDAPRVRKDGSFVPVSGQERMWQIMKILKTFSMRELIVHASLPEAPIADGTARLYCTWLTQGGYLREYSGGEHDVTRYHFIRDTGAKAPQILRVKQLFDPNTGEIVTGEAVEDVLSREPFA